MEPKRYVANELHSKRQCYHDEGSTALQMQVMHSSSFMKLCGISFLSTCSFVSVTFGAWDNMGWGVQSRRLMCSFRSN